MFWSLGYDIDAMATSTVDLSQINMKESIRDMGEDKAMRLLKQVIAKNEIIIRLQKQVLELQNIER